MQCGINGQLVESLSEYCIACLYRQILPNVVVSLDLIRECCRSALSWTKSSSNQYFAHVNDWLSLFGERKRNGINFNKLIFSYMANKLLTRNEIYLYACKNN